MARKLVERRAGDALGEDADGGLVLAGPVAGGGVAADDVVVQDGFELPALGLGELREVRAAVEALLLAGDGDEDDGGGNLSLLRTRAHSRETATPLASSLAPGAGSWVLKLSVLRES
jgi:hypothetical protein